MDKSTLAGALASAAISTAGAQQLPPPMDVMSPYDTPAAAVQRITVPGDVSALSGRRAEAGLENASAAPPERAGLLEPPGGGVAGMLDLDGGRGDAGDEKPEKPEKPEDGDGDG